MMLAGREDTGQKETQAEAQSAVTITMTRSRRSLSPRSRRSVIITRRSGHFKTYGVAQLSDLPAEKWASIFLADVSWIYGGHRRKYMQSFLLPARKRWLLNCTPSAAGAELSMNPRYAEENCVFHALGEHRGNICNNAEASYLRV